MTTFWIILLGVLAFIVFVALIVCGAIFFLIRRSNSFVVIEPDSSLGMLLGPGRYHYRVNAYVRTRDDRYVMIRAFLSSAASDCLSLDSRTAIRDGFEDCVKKALQGVTVAEFYSSQWSFEQKWLGRLERLCFLHGLHGSKISVRTHIESKMKLFRCECRLVAKVS